MKKIFLFLTATLFATSLWATEITLSAASGNAAAAYYLAPDGTAISAIAGSGAKAATYNSGAKITVDGKNNPNATITFTISSGVTITSFKVNGTSQNNTSYDLDGTAVTFGTALTGLSKKSSMIFTLHCKDASSSSSNRNTTITSIVLEYSSGNTLQYNANGGSGTMANSSGTGTITLSANTYTKSGCAFQGWATSQANANAGTVTYADGASYNLSADATLYAVWKLNKPTLSCLNNVVTMEVPGSSTVYYTTTIDGSTPAIPTSSSTAYNPSSKPVISADTKFAVIAILENHISSDTARADFEYVVPAYTLTNVVNTEGYGTVSPASVSGIASETAVSTSLNTYTVNGTTVTATPAEATAEYTYAFDSWSNLPATVTADLTVTANFIRTANSYAVNYTAPSNGTYTIKVGEAEAVSANTTAAYGYTITLAATPSKGYKFISWTVSKAEGTVTVTNNQFTMPAEAVTVSATFEEIVCPTSGVVYSLSMKNTTLSGVTQYAEVELADTYATENGGVSYLGNLNGSTNKAQVTKNGVYFNGNDAYIKVALECAIQTGDTLKFVRGDQERQICVTKNRTRVVNDTTISDTYVFTADFNDVDTIYIWRKEAGATYLKSMTITRPIKSAVTFNPTPADGTVTIKNGDVAIASGDKLPKGTVLTVEATATTANYSLVTLTANGEDIKSSKEFTVGTVAVEVVAVFADATGVDNTADEAKAIKRIENGMLIIEKNGVRYNAQGQVIK